MKSAEEKEGIPSNPILVAMGNIPDKLEKDAENTYQHYRYTSSSHLFSVVRRAVIEAGLIPWQHELSCDILEPDAKGTTHVRIKLELGFSTSIHRPDPEDCEHITVATPMGGPQTFSALRKFAVKYWLIDKFLIGAFGPEEDLDATDAHYSSKKAQKPDRKTEGYWSLDADLNLVPHGTWKNDLERQRGLMKTLISIFDVDKDRNKDELVRAQKIADQNMRLIHKNLPEPGIKSLVDMWNRVGIEMNVP